MKKIMPITVKNVQFKKLVFCLFFAIHLNANAQISSNLLFSVTGGGKFPVDANGCGVAKPTASFLVIKITNNSTTDVLNAGEVTLDSIPSGWTILGPTGGKSIAGKLDPGQSKSLFYYLRANCADKGLTKGIRFTADNGLATQHFRPAIFVQPIIVTASAADITSSIRKLSVLGAIIRDTINYTFKGFGIGEPVLYSPSGLATFKPTLLELQRVYVNSAAPNLGITAGTEDVLEFSAGFTATGSTAYPLQAIAEWKIVAVGDSTQLLPFCANLQGGPIKGVSGDSVATPKKVISIPTSANHISISKTVDVSSFKPGDTLTYTITVHNSSTEADVSIDEIRDTLPTDFIFARIAAGSDALPSIITKMPNAGATGNLSFLFGKTDASTKTTSFLIPKNSSKKLSIRILVGANATGEKTNKAAAFIKSLLLDTGWVTIDQFGDPTIAVENQKNVSCKGGSDAQVKLKGGNGLRPFTFSKDGVNFTADSMFTGLAAGNYTFYVKTKTGKVKSVSVTVTEPASALSASSVVVTHVNCFGESTGAIDLSPTGGTTPYTFSWTGSVSFSASTEDISGLKSGTYSVTVTDANSCTSVNNWVSVGEPTVLGLSLVKKTDVLCFGDLTGDIEVSAIGGTSPYTYKIGSSGYTSSFKFPNLAAGNYIISVKDKNGCTADLSVSISQPAKVIVSGISITDVSCFGAKDGKIEFTASGGTKLQFSIDNGSTYFDKLVFSNLDTGNYTAKVKDINACSVDYSAVNTSLKIKNSDVTKPIAVSKNIILYLNNSGVATLSYAQVNNGSTDNCGIGKFILSDSSFTCADLGKSSQILTAYDLNGNWDTASFVLEVKDTISPVANGKDLVVYLDNLGQAVISTSMVENGSTDNCSVTGSLLDINKFSCTDAGKVVKVKYTVNDASGNSSYDVISITVKDTVLPQVSVKTTVVYLDTAAKGKIFNYSVVSSTSDNCGVKDTSISQYSFTLADTGWVDLLVYVTDVNGNKVGPIKTKVLVLFSDSDKDSIPDYIEGSKDMDGDGVYDYKDLDSDNDGILDVKENEGLNYLLDLDKDGLPDYKDLDTDNDGINDVREVDGSDVDGDGLVGVGTVIVDSNGIPTGASGGYAEIDTDSDKKYDYKDVDSDNDGIPDSVEKGAVGNNPVDTDGDKTPDYRDLDSDNDGIPDTVEKGADGNNPVDTDGDKTPDYLDLDSDNDGIPDTVEKGADGNNPVDTDGDKTPDYLDLDSDNDGIPDSVEKGADGNNPVDTDGDKTPDFLDLDSDNDGIPDSVEKGADGNNPVDTDGDKTPDYLDLDSDNDGIPDSVEKGADGNNPVDTDGDKTPDYLDLDSDNDGIPDTVEKGADGNNKRTGWVKSFGFR